METAIYSTIGLLFVAALSGLSYLATKHPLTYVKYGKYLTYALGAIAVLSFGFSWGVRYAILAAARPLLRPDAIPGSVALADKIDFICGVVAFACVILIGFFTLMAKIGLHIHDREED